MKIPLFAPLVKGSEGDLTDKKRVWVLGTGDGTGKKENKAPAASARLIIATTIGNALEWLDFSAYALFAVFIAREFFPADRPWIMRARTMRIGAAGPIVR